MPISRAVQLAANDLHQPAESIRGIVAAALIPEMPRSARGATFVGRGNLVPGLPLFPQTHEDTVRLGKASELDTIDDWLAAHNFSPPEIRDSRGDRAVLDGSDTTLEKIADRALAILGSYPYLTRQEVLVHLRQTYVAARGGPGTQMAFGYTLVPNFLQAVTGVPDPLNPLRTQHQFSFTITRQHHPNDSPGRETSFQGSVAINDAGSIVSVQAGGQEAVVLPLLRGWIQVSGFVQTMVSANWSRSVSGTAIITSVGPAIQFAAGGQLLVTPNFRSGPFSFLNGHVQFGVQATGGVQLSDEGAQAGVAGSFVINIPFSL
jgi:hypothetical protein